MTTVRAQSYWLESAGSLAPRAPLQESTRADVAILGAGLTGLWTAYELLRREPGLKVVILEREIAGFGASGRNGGWCSSELNASIRLLRDRFGIEQAVAVQRALYDTVDEVARVCTDQGIDADYQKGGMLLVARGRQQVPALDAAEADYREVGLPEHYVRLGAEQLGERVRIAGAVEALFSPHCAVVHPGKLVRGLARTVERLGGVIYEQTEVTGYETQRGGPTLRTVHGDVHADSIVLAGEAYLTQLRPLRRRLLPVYSLIVMTEPLPESVWGEIGWRSRECMASMRLTIDYLSRTADGRILFGGRGAPYNFGSAISAGTEHHKRTHDALRRMLAEWFPASRGVKTTHAWGGVLGVPRDIIPSFTYDRGTGIGMAAGYAGHGVAATNLAGRTLADLITGRETALTHLPLANHRSPEWEIEPLRWLGVRAVQVGLARVDARAERTGRAPTGRTIAERLARH
ncbi:MAG TPA: FAD-dependent oxidoreductase [Candidatus Dormibacteraeota bacterium]|nr:FAD-dependent oxidoreductase [Candidatus Dormibacteraeota bacterium]